MPYANLEVRRAYSARYQRERKLSTRYYRENAERRRKQLDTQREKRFGITPEEYEARLEAQAGVCLLCGQDETDRTTLGFVKRLAVDHDWETGEIRGLLCRSCNVRAGRTGPLHREGVMPI